MTVPDGPAVIADLVRVPLALLLCLAAWWQSMPLAIAVRYRSLDRFGFIPLVVLMYLARPVVGVLLSPAFFVESGLLNAVAPFAVAGALNIFPT